MVGIIQINNCPINHFFRFNLIARIDKTIYFVNPSNLLIRQNYGQNLHQKVSGTNKSFRRFHPKKSTPAPSSHLKILRKKIENFSGQFQLNHCRTRSAGLLTQPFSVN